MRFGAIAFLAVSLAGGLYAQGRRSTTPVVVGTVGSVVHPGTPAGMAGVTRNPAGIINPGGGGVRLVVPGQNRPVAPNGGQRFRGVYAYPVYVGSYYDPYVTPQEYVNTAPSQPNVTVVTTPQPQPAPVIVNNYYSGYPPPQVADGGRIQNVAEPDEPSPALEPAHYLIAFQDHTIYAANAYWVDGDTLHYFTSGNTHNQVSLALVDRSLTERLNKESGIEVKLPTAR
jgi:hypothetical protein